MCPSRLRRLLACLIDSAVAHTATSPIAVTATLAEREPGEPRLRLGVRGDVISDAMSRAIVTALATDLGGTIAFDSDGATAELPLVRDEAAAVEPDLMGRKVAMVTADRDLADRLRAWLGGWGADAQWFTAADAALASLGSAPLVVILDGRHDPLASLSLAHRLATGAEPAAILFIAPHDASGAVAGLAAARLAAVIEEPVTEGALASAVLSVIAAAGDAPAPAAGLALLIADHDPANRERIKTLLERAGHAIEAAADGGAALAALDGGGFDAALIALDMPGVSGDAVARLHRLRHPGGTLPLFALVANGSAETEARCREAGFDAVLRRPFDAAELGPAVAGARAARGTATRSIGDRQGST